MSDTKEPSAPGASSDPGHTGDGRGSADASAAQMRLLEVIRELQDIKAALDEHSIVAMTDAAGRITYVNDRFCAISQYSREELLGSDHRIINSGVHPSSFFRGLWGSIGRGIVWHGEICNRAKDGSLYWVDTTIFPRMDAGGRPVQYVAIRTDITRRKADETEIKRTAAALAETNKELEAIVYTVSHDLRSPLVNVQGFSRQLGRACDRIRAAVAGAGGGAVPAAELSAPVDVAIPQALRFINAGVAKMEMLLDGLLRFSRLGRVTLTIQPVDLEAVVSEAVAALRFQLDEVGAVATVGALPSCLGDRAQVGRVFTNLIDNALKYRDPARPLVLAITGRMEAADGIISFVDNGIGIAPEHQGRIFEIFHRLDPDQSAGEGLGLTIAQRLLERQGGRIWVESTPGVGSTFHVALPLAGTIQPPA